MCGGGSVHKESGGDSNAAMLQVWAWAQVAGAGACVCVRGRRREPRAHGCGQTGADLKACLGRSCVGVSCFHSDVPVSGLLSLSYGCTICRRTSVSIRTSEACSDPRNQSVVRIGFWVEVMFWLSEDQGDFCNVKGGWRWSVKFDVNYGVITEERQIKRRDGNVEGVG